MIFGCIVEGLTGLVCIVMGLLIWKKRMLSLLHEYHYRHVKRADVPAYTRMIGIGIILIGAGIIITGILNLFYSPYWWIPLTAGMVSGLIVMFIAQKKYNGSVLG